MKNVNQTKWVVKLERVKKLEVFNNRKLFQVFAASRTEVVCGDADALLSFEGGSRLFRLQKAECKMWEEMLMKSSAGAESSSAALKVKVTTFDRRLNLNCETLIERDLHPVLTVQNNAANRKKKMESLVCFSFSSLRLCFLFLLLTTRH